MSQRVLVVAPHPDDEVLGVGGTMAKFAAEGAEVHVLIVTKGYPPDFPEDVVETGRREARAAHQILGVKDTQFLSFPAAALDTVPHRELNAHLLKAFQQQQPEIVFVPFFGDVHSDHQRISLSTLVAARPSGGVSPCVIYAYETVSETNWNAPYISPSFIPNVFVDISDYLETKLKAARTYASQMKPFPHERSIEVLRALATMRGGTIGRHAAEAFVLVRHIL